MFDAAVQQQKTSMFGTASYYHIDDIVVWPDGTNAARDDVLRGEFDFMSDDYEIVRLEDEARLIELGLGDLVDDALG